MKQLTKCREFLPLFILLLILLQTFNRCETSKNLMAEGSNNVIIWNAENSPYVINTFTIERGTKLIIEAGVTVAFKTGQKLIVKGKLQAIGTRSAPIKFTVSPDTSVLGYKDYWCGIEFDSCEDNTYLEYSIFEKYWGPEFAILCDNSSPTFNHCVFPGFTPAIETGGGIISCINNSSPRIEYSRLSMYGWYTVCVACAKPTGFINPDSSNPRLFENDFYITNDGYAVAGGGFLNGNYINIQPGKVDTSLGIPVDEIGDGIFTTNSESCKNVDGITNPRITPHFPDNSF